MSALGGFKFKANKGFCFLPTTSNLTCCVILRGWRCDRRAFCTDTLAVVHCLSPTGPFDLIWSQSESGKPWILTCISVGGWRSYTEGGITGGGRYAGERWCIRCWWVESGLFVRRGFSPALCGWMKRCHRGFGRHTELCQDREGIRLDYVDKNWRREKNMFVQNVLFVMMFIQISSSFIDLVCGCVSSRDVLLF